MIHDPFEENIVALVEPNMMIKIDSSEEILIDDQTCYSSMSNSSSAATSECGYSDEEEFEQMIHEESIFSTRINVDVFKSALFEYPFNAEYEDIFEQELVDDVEYEGDEYNQEDIYANDYEEYEEYNFNHCLGGMKFKHLANMKKVKQKFKTKRINPKRRIHHRELKKQTEQANDKREQIESKVYIPPSIHYADYSNNRHQHSSRGAKSNSDEESQLQQAITQSLTDHHVDQYARECGIEYNLLLALTQRELTAEDYDLLLQLDNTVKKKTVSENILDSLPCCTLNRFGELCQSDMPQVCEGDMCITCMCDFEEGDELRWIPKCSHIFHKNCIDSWLNNHSTCCPICRVEVNS